MEENSIDITVSIYKDEKIVYIGEENSSGCKYRYNNKSDIVKAFKDYIKYYSSYNNKN